MQEIEVGHIKDKKPQGNDGSSTGEDGGREYGDNKQIVAPRGRFTRVVVGRDGILSFRQTQRVKANLNWGLRFYSKEYIAQIPSWRKRPIILAIPCLASNPNLPPSCLALPICARRRAPQYLQSAFQKRRWQELLLQAHRRHNARSKPTPIGGGGDTQIAKAYKRRSTSRHHATPHYQSYMLL
ncbi:hypothetical protein BDN72DRAFT_882880 [Pluteus cervinus]|uniref:Uncharacterized protein n=1 Tax=Pluteus cervinus TaxID=181527 RepID=A0ACD3A8S5_9AGAR|nr:hypothetical protein BDN72DRAFT_882880 [Pluteus cervinus]